MPDSLQLAARISREQKSAIRRMLNPVGALAPVRKLQILAMIHGTDKLGHGYIEHYSKHFGPLRHRRLNILEIGIGGYQDPKAGANSLRMWQAYFPRSIIYGLDIWDKRYHEDKRLKIFQGSQNDPEFLQWLMARIGHLDIVIDDGSHISEHVRTSFNVIFPKLRSPGIYVIEDIHTSYLTEFGGDSDDLNNPLTSMSLLKSVLDSVNYQYITGRALTSLHAGVQAVSVYPKIAFIHKGQGKQRFDGIRRGDR